MEAFLPELWKIMGELSRIPYENLTKTLALRETRDPLRSLDTPGTLYRKSLEWGAGGTCYPLTFYLKKKLDEADIHTEFLLARKYGRPNVHCGLLLDFLGRPYLLDPGYLIFQPLALPVEPVRKTKHPLKPNAVTLENLEAEGLWRMYTGTGREHKFRFDFIKDPVPEPVFTEAWKQTFYFPMMAYPVLNRLDGEVQHYLQKNTYVIRGARESQTQKLDRAGFHRVACGIFGLDAGVVDDYLELLRREKRDSFFI